MHREKPRAPREEEPQLAAAEKPEGRNKDPMQPKK